MSTSTQQTLTKGYESSFSFQDFPIGCPLTIQQIIPQDFIDEATELITNLTAISLVSYNKPVSQALITNIVRIFMRTVKFLKMHVGLNGGISPKIAQLLRSGKPRNASDKIDKDAELVLHSFANIVHNFANIVGDPHNPDIVANNITHMFSGFVYVAKETITKGAVPGLLNENVDFFRKRFIKSACDLNHENLT